jgi:hypothetical protein
MEGGRDGGGVVTSSSDEVGWDGRPVYRATGLGVGVGVLGDEAAAAAAAAGGALDGREGLTT